MSKTGMILWASSEVRDVTRAPLVRRVGRRCAGDWVSTNRRGAWFRENVVGATVVGSDLVECRVGSGSSGLRLNTVVGE